MITLEQAKQHLNAWLEADLALATGKSYRIGSRNLTRADAGEIRERISYWQRQVELMSAQSKRGNRVVRLVPRDL